MPLPLFSISITSLLLSSSIATASPHLHPRAGGSSVHNDVLNGANFPDPSLLSVNGRTYVFGTVDGSGHNIPVTSNANFNNPADWSAITDAFPTANVPAFGDNGWAVAGTTWAPDVNHLVSLAHT